MPVSKDVLLFAFQRLSSRACIAASQCHGKLAIMSGLDDLLAKTTKAGCVTFFAALRDDCIKKESEQSEPSAQTEA
jgi:hypothetical protein